MEMRLIRSDVVELRGIDALAFAHAQFMNDVRVLGDGQWQWNGWLTPKGRLIAFFAIVRADAQTLLAWLPAGGGQAFAERLRRFVFRSKVSIDPSSWIAYGTTDDPERTLTPDPTAESAAHGDDVPTKFVVPYSSAPTAAARSLVLKPAAHGERGDGFSDDTAALARWQRADLLLGIPYITADSANSEQFIPQWLSLERLNAFNLKKGCYPGQEIVARMHYLGQSKRAAYRLRGSGNPPAPRAAVLDADGQAIGDIVWSVSDTPSNWLALAVLTVDQSDRVASVEAAGAASTIND